MMNRIVSFGVLLFSFALALFGFQPKDNSISFTINIPVFSAWVYWVIGTFGVAASLFFLIMAMRSRWSAKTDKFLHRKEVFFPVFVVFLGVYTISYLKEFAAVIQASPPAWVEYLAFFVGIAIFLYLVVLGLKRLIV